MSQSTSVDDIETQSGSDKKQIEIQIDNVDASTDSMEVDQCNYFDKIETYLLTKDEGDNKKCRRKVNKGVKSIKRSMFKAKIKKVAYRCTKNSDQRKCHSLRA